jgi:hypothetical protein
VTAYHGRRALLLVTTLGATAVDSMLAYADGLAPIWETTRSGPNMTSYRYDGTRVEVTVAAGDSVLSRKEHQYAFPVFNFQELDALLRALPFTPRYEALLPLYSEGDDVLEVDTVRVEAKDARGVWKLRFADAAVVATVGIDDASRRQVEYSHTFRADGPAWKAQTVWRRVYHVCGERKT